MKESAGRLTTRPFRSARPASTIESFSSSPTTPICKSLRELVPEPLQADDPLVKFDLKFEVDSANSNDRLRRQCGAFFQLTFRVSVANGLLDFPLGGDAELLEELAHTLIEAAKANRYCHRDATMILVALRNGPGGRALRPALGDQVEFNAAMIRTAGQERNLQHASIARR
jgi:hypothetical protein